MHMAPQHARVAREWLRRSVRAKLTLKKYDNFCEEVADAYDELPEKQEDQKWRWDALRDHVDKFFKQMQSKVKVRFVEGQPYQSAKEMRDKVKETGVLEISNEGNEHPIFTPEENLRFRAVHDYIVHIIPGDEGPDFSEKGEIKAFNLHRKLAPKDAWPALFTEVAAQACYANARGKFPEQKVSILPQFDPLNVGNYSDGTPVDPDAAREPRSKTPEKQPSKSRGERADPAKFTPGTDAYNALWEKFVTESVPNPEYGHGGKQRDVQRKTLLERGGPAKDRVMADWKRHLNEARKQRA